MKNTVVTTSWDDGHVLDMRLADLLRKYDLAGTFYVAPENRQIPEHLRLTDDQLVALSKDFEIGAHTMTHPRLSEISEEDARKEIASSKERLQNILGRDVKSFCYPSGDYRDAHKKMVRDAGFSLARTVERFRTDIGDDHFAMPTTVHAYRHWSDARPIFREAGAGNFLKHYLNWDDLAIALFDDVQKNGGVFHLWGHSWEIDKNGDWDRLESVMKHISRRPEIRYSTNEQLI